MQFPCDPDKPFYRIGEVAKAAGVKPHVLHFWEAQFPTLIRTTRSKGGHRVYNRAALVNVMTIRELLYVEGYTIAGAKRALTKARSAA